MSKAPCKVGEGTYDLPDVVVNCQSSKVKDCANSSPKHLNVNHFLSRYQSRFLPEVLPVDKEILNLIYQMKAVTTRISCRWASRAGPCITRLLKISYPLPYYDLKKWVQAGLCSVSFNSSSLIVTALRNAFPASGTHMDVQLHILPLAEACELVTRTEQREEKWKQQLHTNSLSHTSTGPHNSTSSPNLSVKTPVTLTCRSPFTKVGQKWNSGWKPVVQLHKWHNNGSKRL